MEDLDSVQNEIDAKLEHVFDTRHIYQMFSTFVATIRTQTNQIREMQENAERSEAQIENMGQTIRNMEMNIQGFITLPPPDDDDENTLKASRRPSISSRRPSKQDSNNLIENAVKSISSGDSDASSTNKKEDKKKSWKYKKRRIIRQVSLKLSEETSKDIDTEEEKVDVDAVKEEVEEDSAEVEQDKVLKSTMPVDINKPSPKPIEDSSLRDSSTVVDVEANKDLDETLMKNTDEEKVKVDENSLIINKFITKEKGSTNVSPRGPYNASPRGLYTSSPRSETSAESKGGVSSKKPPRSKRTSVNLEGVEARRSQRPSESMTPPTRSGSGTGGTCNM